MANANDISIPVYQRILVLGKGGCGKTTQILTLPGKKFAYIFDPGALPSLRGHDVEYEAFLPDALEMDATLKGFNKNSKADDQPKGKSREPKAYKNWVDDLNAKSDSGFFSTVDWLILDSLTLLTTAVMDRQLWINNRYGSIEELGDFRVAGAKLADVFRSVFSLPVNIYCTGHINTYEDEKTKKLNTAVLLPGRARNMIPLLCSNIWELRPSGTGKFELVTQVEQRGFQEIRTSIPGLKPVEDITITNFKNPEASGIGALLKKANVLPVRPPVTAPDAAVKLA